MRFGKNRVIDSILLPDLRRRSDCRESSFIEYIHHIAGYDGLWRGITVLFHKNYSRLFFIKEVFMLNKLLRSIGIGSARIDTVLKDSTVVPGSYLRGEVRITGGKSQLPTRQDSPMRSLRCARGPRTRYAIQHSRAALYARINGKKQGLGSNWS